MMVIARVMAIGLAGGDEAIAESYLDWATRGMGAKPKTNKDVQKKYRTEIFIQNYLNPSITLGYNAIIQFINRYILKHPRLDYHEIKAFINSLTYQDFLKTPYWTATATYIKSKYKKCIYCGSSTNLQVHHKTYKKHGDEINHEEDLLCVCDECHKRLHNK